MAQCLHSAGYNVVAVRGYYRRVGRVYMLYVAWVWLWLVVGLCRVGGCFKVVGGGVSVAWFGYYRFAKPYCFPRLVAICPHLLPVTAPWRAVTGVRHRSSYFLHT